MRYLRHHRLGKDKLAGQWVYVLYRRTSVGLDDDTADWTFHVGYYRSGMGFHIDTGRTPSFNESAGVWRDPSAAGEAHIYIGGNIDIATTWIDRHEDYTGSINVTFTCN